MAAINRIAIRKFGQLKDSYRFGIGSQSKHVRWRLQVGHHRCLFNFGRKKQDTTAVTTIEPEENRYKENQLLATEVTPSQSREKFIPITRRSVIRHLMQEPSFLSEKEQDRFEHFSLMLDSAIVNRYHAYLQELKSLFDPIDPDKDTIATRHWTRKQRLDNEFWLMQKLEQIMDKANFHKMSRDKIEQALAEKRTRGVMVSVKLENYDILNFWALGKEKPRLDLEWYEKLAYKLTFRSLPQSEEYYKRVVVAVRLKRDEKLILKMFKEVPVHSLEKLLPDGKIKMSKLDKTIMSTTIGFVLTGIIAKILALLAHVYVEWTVLLTFVAGLTAARAWTVYKNRSNAYLGELSRMLYFRNIANNRGLLTLLVDRAEDELFKEALLVYTFLLTNRPPSERLAESTDQDPQQLGGISLKQLEIRIQDWVLQKTKCHVEFDSLGAIDLLKGMGLLSEDYEKNLHVLALEAAIRNLPLTPQSVIDRAQEFDQLEGYDRYEMDDEQEKEERKRKLYGWF